MAGTKPFTTEQQAAVAAVLRSFPLRDQALITFLTHTGFRISEALSLEVGDVTAGGSVRPRVRVARAQLKGGRSCRRRSISGRSVPLNAEVSAVLAEYLFQRFGSAYPPDSSEPLFLSRQGTGPVSRWQANRIIHAVLSTAGVEVGAVPGEYGSHSLRKVFCRRIYEATGHDIMLTRAAMGHQSIETTQHYLSVGDDEVDRAVLALAGAENQSRAEAAARGREAALL